MLRMLLKSRRGESLIEVLAAGVVFMLLLGTLRVGTQFAAGALVRARVMRESVTQFQQSVYQNLADGKAVDGGAGAVSFGGGSFAVPVRFQTV